MSQLCWMALAVVWKEIAMMRWMGKRLVLVLGLLAVAALLLAACGGGDDDDNAGDDGGATATEADATDDAGDDGGDDGGDGSTDDGADNASGSDFDVCTLLTRDEVERVIGPADEGLNQNFDPIFSCLWSADAGGVDYVSVGVFAGSDEEVEAFFELTQDAEEVQGIGDRAQFSDTIGIGTLEVLVDGYDVSVSVAMLERDRDEARDITTGLAERVLGRLQ